MIATDKNLGRHARKSRAGCFNCKARKVKCSEKRPACENCMIREQECIYPSKAEQRTIRRRIPNRLTPPTGSDNDLSISSPVSLNSTPTCFKPADFQYFHHFITAAHPHLPHGNDDTWSLEIPKLAHHYEPLLHAVLSLGATHFELLHPNSQYCTDALAHRGLAFSGLRTLIAKGNHTATELDVLLAMCYTLTMQSGYMEDGLTDFLTMIRGCALITGQIIACGEMISLFKSDPSEHLEMMSNVLPSTPVFDPALMNSGIEALEEIKFLLTEDSHIRFYDAMLETLVASQRSGLEAYMTFREVYVSWLSLDECTFQTFVSPENKLTRTLFIYFAALIVIMIPNLVHEVPERMHKYNIFGTTMRWVDGIVNNLPPDLHRFLKWPVGVVRAVWFGAEGADINVVVGRIRVALESADMMNKKTPTGECLRISDA